MGMKGFKGFEKQKRRNAEKVEASITGQMSLEDFLK